METNTFLDGAPMHTAAVPKIDEPDDDQLVASTRQDPAQFACLYRRYAARVYRYFYGRTGATADAEDLTAQLFLDVLSALPGYRPRGSFAAWLFTLARRRAADHFRRQRSSLPLDWAPDIPAAGPDPLGEVQQRENRVRLAQLFARLEPDKQELVRLRYAAGLSHRQIGQVLGRSEAAVAMAMHRIVQWFQQNWEEPHA
jgi:RNA polymerase sigma-70 factor (ECF subfamily)